MALKSAKEGKLPPAILAMQGQACRYLIREHVACNPLGAWLAPLHFMAPMAENDLTGLRVAINMHANASLTCMAGTARIAETLLLDVKIVTVYTGSTLCIEFEAETHDKLLCEA